MMYVFNARSSVERPLVLGWSDDERPRYPFKTSRAGAALLGGFFVSVTDSGLSVGQHSGTSFQDAYIFR